MAHGFRARHPRWLANGVALLVVAAACTTVPSAPAAAPGAATSGTPPPAAKSAPIGGGSMTYRLSSDWTTLDPMVNPNATSLEVGLPAYDRLVAVGPDNKLVPYLASAWQASPTSVTFTVRKDATCSDGTPVTPTLVANSFKRLFDPKNAVAGLARRFGATAGHYNVSADDAASTLTVSIDAPSPDLLGGFATGYANIVCPAGLVDPAQIQTQMFGSGPYTMVSAVHGDSIVFKLRPEWKWGPNNTTASMLPDQLTYKVVVNQTTAANLLTTGDLDVGWVSGPDVQRLTADKNLTHKLVPSDNFGQLIYNEAPGHATADPAVRAALSTATDQQAWVNAVSGGDGTPAKGVVPSTFPCYDSETEKQFPQPGGGDTAKARAMLEAAGWTMSGAALAKDGKPLSIVVIGFPDHGSGPEYLVTQYTKVGIAATLSVTDRTTWQNNQVAGNFDVSPTTVGGGGAAGTGVPGWLNFLPTITGEHPPAGQNWGRVSDPDLTAAVNAAVTATESNRCSAWAQVQRLTARGNHFFFTASFPVHYFSRNVDLVVPGEVYARKRLSVP